MKIKSKIPLFAILILLALLSIIFSLLIGRYQISIEQLTKLVLSRFIRDTEVPQQVETIIINIRFPRVIVAFLIGGTLSITGAAYQGMFRNPMVSPSILGVSAGAGFGAALAIILGLGTLALQFISFASGIFAVVAVYLISLATSKKFDRYLTLILSGMIVTTVFTAMISILKYIADPDDTLPSIVYWLMGGLSGIEMRHLLFITIISFTGLLLLTLSGWKLDILSFGDDEAKTMGVNVEYFRILVIGIATLMTASAVSISGIIGWVGLLIPHISRMIVGPKNTVLLPASFLVGGIFLLIVDDFSRSVSSMEIPLGITTSLIGAPFFIYVLLKTAKKD